jgi:hypothetical protein
LYPPGDAEALAEGIIEASNGLNLFKKAKETIVRGFDAEAGADS